MCFGVYIDEYRAKDRYKVVCECGNSFYIDSNMNLLCEKCNNTKFERIRKSVKQLSKVIFKTNDSINKIHSVREILTYKYDDLNNKLTLDSRSGKYEFVMDFKNWEFNFIDGKGIKKEFSNGVFRYFLKRNCHYDDFVNSCKCKSNRTLLNAITKLDSCYYSPVKSMGYFIQEAFKSLQVLSNAGYSENFIKSYISSRYHNVSGTLDVHNNETKPHKIIGVPRIIANYIKNIDNITLYDLVEIKGLDNNKCKEILNQLDLQCDNNDKLDFIRNMTDFNNMISDYKYDVKRLITYLCRDIKLEQGIMSPIEGLRLLKDLNNMCRDMEVKPNERYPKSLKRDHDITVMNYRSQEDHITKKKFAKVVNDEEYSNNTYSNKKYSVCIPNEPKDLIKEGKGLHHCVASYVKDVINGKCKIYFIRDKEELDKSLLTVEVRRNEIIQVRGFGNRKPDDKEKCFINEWMKNKNLSY